MSAWAKDQVELPNMAVQAFRNVIPRGDLVNAVLPIVIVGVALIVLAPAKIRAAGPRSPYR